jgi:hypothetical protein
MTCRSISSSRSPGEPGRRIENLRRLIPSRYALQATRSDTQGGIPSRYALQATRSDTQGGILSRYALLAT